MRLNVPEWGIAVKRVSVARNRQGNRNTGVSSGAATALRQLFPRLSGQLFAGGPQVCGDPGVRERTPDRFRPGPAAKPENPGSPHLSAGDLRVEHGPYR